MHFIKCKIIWGISLIREVPEAEVDTKKSNPVMEITWKPITLKPNCSVDETDCIC
jgi:hypothetical protein